MPTVVQFRRGTTAQNDNFLGAAGEISVDTDLDVLRVADGATLGGFALVGQDCVQTITNKTYTGTSLSVTGNVTAANLNSSNADLAEMYSADQLYAPGTVLEFGGEKEVTATTTSHSTRIAGIVSTNPSYLMNATLDCATATEVALVGRVPCQVVGTIHKGDRLTSSKIPGVAQTLNSNLYEPGCIVGKALESYNSTEPGVIEVAVGRL